MLHTFEPLIHYADNALERGIGIRFRKLRQDELKRVKGEVNQLRDVLGKAPIEIVPPAKGLLDASLNGEQRTVLNEALGLRYAERNIEQQRTIMKISIVECLEHMVHLPSFFRDAGVSAKFSKRPFHAACGPYAGAERIPYVRRSVAEKLADAFVALEKIGLHAFVEDCWRPPEVQEGLYRRRIEGIARGTNWTPPQIQEVTSSLTASVPGLAGHQAGAAIDWRIQDDDGRLLDLGNTYAEGKPVSSINFPYVTGEQWRTRTLFAELMRAAGLKLLATEDWHASDGDRGMSLERQARLSDARYGPIKQFDPRSGAVEPYSTEEVDKPYFSTEDVARIVAEVRGK